MKDGIDSAKIKIMICCHKPCELPKDDIFLPIQVGAAISSVDLGMQRDDQVNGDECDNISAKNKSYCELTAMYWAWKNIKKLCPDLEYIGLCHYRRYFAFDKMFFLPQVLIHEKEVEKYSFSKKYLVMKKNEVLLSSPFCFPTSLAVDYSIHHYSKDYLILKKIIHDDFPEYFFDFCQVMENNNKLSAFNMFIMPWQIFEDYSSWLFSVLKKTENFIDITNYDAKQKRIFGYMAERLLNVYFSKWHSIRRKRSSVFFYVTEIKHRFPILNDNLRKKILSLKNFALNQKYNKSFRLGNQLANFPMEEQL